MDGLIWFFRDFISGWKAVLYVFFCLLFMFACLGVLGDIKKALVQKKIKEQREKDIAEGKDAKMAALEGKQVISADPSEGTTQATSETASAAITGANAVSTTPSTDGANAVTDNAQVNSSVGDKEEEAPAVLVLGNNK